MLVTIIFAICMLITLIALNASVKPLNKKRNNILFGVTLPDEAFQHEDVIDLQNNYAKELSKIILLFIVLMAPILIPIEYFSIKLFYVSLWFIGFLYLSYYPFRKCNKKMADLKKKNGWLVGSKGIVSVDIRVSRLKDTMFLKSYYFILPILISLIVLFIAYNKDNQTTIIFSMIYLAINMICFIMYRQFTKMRTKVYSKISDINLAINTYSKKKWSIFWFVVSLIQSFILVSIVFMYHNQMNSSYMFIILTVIISISIITLLIHTFNSIKKVEHLLIKEDEQQIIVDNDAYWINGMIYNNPNDQSVFIEKRAGIGNTVNLATFKGKLYAYGGYILIPIIIIPILIFTSIDDFKEPRFTFMENDTITIDSTIYDYEFSLDDIQSIQLIDELPSGIKTNGSATSRYARGSFNLNGYGSTKLFVMKKHPPFIVIELSDNYVIYNSSDENKTYELYKKMTTMYK